MRVDGSCEPGPLAGPGLQFSNGEEMTSGNDQSGQSGGQSGGPSGGQSGGQSGDPSNGPGGNQQGDRLGTSLFGGESRNADYAAWAERLKAKRDRNRQVVADLTEQPTDEAAPNYWSTDALYAESARVREHEQAEAHSHWEAEERKVELGNTLGMHGEINLTTANEAFRRLAKLHHPDRYVDADAGIQDHHAAEMMKVNGAYAALKKLLAEAPAVGSSEGSAEPDFW